MPDVLLKTLGLSKTYTLPGGLTGRNRHVRALDDVSLDIREGETLGLVGESGCGKSTLGRLLVRLDTPTAGKIVYAGRHVAAYTRDEARTYIRNVQIVFQDPYASLNPRKTVGSAIEEPLIIHGLGDKAERKARVLALMEKVGLNENHCRRYPHEFSGGQRQRIGIARSLILNPRLIVADEPVSALDVSIQAQILNLLKDLQRDFSLTYFFITHDLSVVRFMSDRVAVMYLGRIVELAATDALFAAPLHPYTRTLLDAVPTAAPESPVRRPRRPWTAGDAPEGGCAFYPRCPEASDDCRTAVPDLRETSPGHFAACLAVKPS